MIDPNFVLIDLRAQFTEVQAYVAGWDEAKVLKWLESYGRVEPFEFSGGLGYMFIAVCGLATIFHFDTAAHLRWSAPPMPATDI